MDLTDVVVIGLATILGATAHGSTGVGIGLVAGPVLATVDPRFLPGPLMLVSMVIAGRHLLAERHNIDRGLLGRLVLGLPVGVVAAVAVLVAADERTLALGIGGLVVALSILLMAGFHPARTHATEFLGGAGAAFGSVTAALPGPPLVMSLHDLPGEVMRPTVAAVGSLLSVVTVAALASIGRFGAAEFGLTTLLVPFALIGLLVARLVRPWMDRALFRPIVLSIAFAGGVSLIVRNL